MKIRKKCPAENHFLLQVDASSGYRDRNRLHGYQKKSPRIEFCEATLVYFQLLNYLVIVFSSPSWSLTSNVKVPFTPLISNTLAKSP